MGLVTLLKIFVKSFDLLAWPLITLVYPICSSIQAIESNSNGENRKWLIYWVLYALIMLFELTSGNLFKWLPFWPYIKLIVVCWLVLPHFDGAGYVYEHFVRPCFAVTPQTFSNWFKIPQTNKFCIDGSDDFIHVAERYIEENGFEELEKLISGKAKCTETSHSRTENNVVTENTEAAALEVFKCMEISHDRTENNAVTENTEAASVEFFKHMEISHARTENNAATENTEAAALEFINLIEPNLAQTENVTVRTVEKETMTGVGTCRELPMMPEVGACRELPMTEVATGWELPMPPEVGTGWEIPMTEVCTGWQELPMVTEVATGWELPMTPEVGTGWEIPMTEVCTGCQELPMATEVATGRELPSSSCLKKVQKEWTCALCQVSTSDKDVLKSHYRGKKHRAKQMELKELKNKAASASASASKKSKQPAGAPKKGESTTPRPNQKKDKKHEEKKAGDTRTGDQCSQKQKKTEVEKNQSALWCDTCKLLCNSTSMMISHLSGKKHLNRCKELFVGSQTKMSEQSEQGLKDQVVAIA